MYLHYTNIKMFVKKKNIDLKDRHEKFKEEGSLGDRGILNRGL